MWLGLVIHVVAGSIPVCIANLGDQYPILLPHLLVIIGVVVHYLLGE